MFLYNFHQALLELYVPIWLSALKCDIDLLESAQHQATRLIPSQRSLDYEKRLKALDLTISSEIRQRGDMNFREVTSSDEMSLF